MLLTHEELQARLIALHRASLELVRDISLETLLRRIAALARELVDAEYAAVGVLDESGELAEFVAEGMDAETMAALPHPPRGQGLIGELMHARQPLRLEDLHEHPRSVGYPPGHPEMTSFLGAPIRLGERQLGQIYLTNKRSAAAFTADDEMLVEMLANYAAVAVHNARLYAQLNARDRALSQRNADLTLLNDIASALTSSLELEDILHKTLSLAMNYLHMDAGEIFLLDEDGETLRMKLHRGDAAEAFWSRDHFKLGEGLVGLTAQRRAPVVSRDLAQDGTFLRRAVVEAGFRQLACVPLIGSDSALVGVMGVARRSQEAISAHEIQLLTAVGNWSGLAIENARLHADARRLAILEERERIGMDLHDGVIQDLYGVGLTLDNVLHLMATQAEVDVQPALRQAIDGLNHAIRDLRAYILDLRPHQLGQGTLYEGLKKLVMEYRAHTLSDAVLTVNPDELASLSEEQTRVIFRICQEALANAAKHARARRVNVSLWTTRERLMLEVQDDGQGFDMEKMRLSIGHGLSNMLRRARAVGGDVEITSAPGEGTTILAWLPRNTP